MGDGTFSSVHNYGAGLNPFSVATGDFDEDGHTDLAVLNNDSENVSILLNLAEGSAVEEDGQSLPTSSNLLSIYPNPFNAQATLHYQLYQDEYISLKVYNILGAEVGVLVDEYQEQGLYQLRWDTKDLASGIYFCRLQAGEYAETAKMVLLR
jgi:hypothetical protein